MQLMQRAPNRYGVFVRDEAGGATKADVDP